MLNSFFPRLGFIANQFLLTIPASFTTKSFWLANKIQGYKAEKKVGIKSASVTHSVQGIHILKLVN